MKSMGYYWAQEFVHCLALVAAMKQTVRGGMEEDGFEGQWGETVHHEHALCICHYVVV
jgi:hypothetical protein